MEGSSMKIVDFEKCETCKHKDVVEQNNPCYECLSVPARPDSRVPLYYEKKE